MVSNYNSLNNTQSASLIAEICKQHGLSHAVLSPGSRCAPLVLAFTRLAGMQCWSIPDERAAAFVGTGIASYTGQPAVLICTSGSAAYNYAPAVAEAFYRHVPLLILTADRPPEWIDQWDGQTIRQDGVFGNHVKASFTLPTDLGHNDAQWHAERIVNEAINCAMEGPQGPVHINIPFREPLYGENAEKKTAPAKIIRQSTGIVSLPKDEIKILKDEWSKHQRKLLLIGQSAFEQYPQSLFTSLAKRKVTVIADILSNAHGQSYVIRHGEVICGDKAIAQSENLQPDLLITVGLSTISKQTKLYLRKHKPNAHWHIAPHGKIGDTFQSLTRIIRANPAEVFDMLPRDYTADQNRFNSTWQDFEQKSATQIRDFKYMDTFNEIMCYKAVMDCLPKQCNLHLANSMAVRYANYFGLNPTQKNIKVFVNRGTSGIDGSNSTAVGCALVAKEPTVLLTGDMAFLYDRNAFWHNHETGNLKIIVFNNHGGGIFNMIPGPSDYPEYKQWFETRQQLTAEPLAKEFGFAYEKCTEFKKIQPTIYTLFSTKGTAILEIETNSETNKEALSHFKKALKLS